MDKKVKIYSAFDRPKTIPHPRCTKVVMEHSLHINEKTGEEYLVLDTERRVYDYIQEGREETLVANIVRKYKEGDANALAAMNGKFIDIMNAPTSLLDALVSIRKAEQEFDTLPLDIRTKFNNDPNQFIAGYGTNDWADKMGLIKKQPELTPEPAPVPEGGTVANE